MTAKPMLIVAHRGASLLAPESTAAAIRVAQRSLADMIELDVQMTKDRRLVVFHDERLDRTTTGRGRLAARRYAELARLDCGSWFAPSYARERILLASQALRLIQPPCLINLELKRTWRPAILIRRLLRCVRWTRTHTRVLVSSFSESLLRVARREDPTMARALLCRRHPERALRAAVKLECAALHPHVSLVTAVLVRRTHDAGLRLHVWTVDAPAEARRLCAFGVDGIITNAPDRIRRALGHDRAGLSAERRRFPHDVELAQHGRRSR